MKKVLLSLVCLWVLGLGEAKAQWVTIPDTNFVSYLQQEFPSCMNGNQMDTTCPGVVGATTMYCAFKNIRDFNGIHHFIGLKELNCRGNLIVNMPTLPPQLEFLYCGDNKLISFLSLPSSLQTLTCDRNKFITLPTLNQNLTVLDCSSNQLTSLPLPPSSLKRLNCSQNQITTLPVLNDSLNELICTNNLLTSLPSLPLLLKKLWCTNNQIASLPALLDSLYELDCSRNQLRFLPTLPQSLKTLNCSWNQLNSLPSLPTSLTSLHCADNLLSTLPVLPQSLLGLSCWSNQLDSLPLLPSSLSFLACSYNHLTFLPLLPSSLLYLYCDHNRLTILPDLPPVLRAFMVNDNPDLLCMPHLEEFQETQSGQPWHNDFSIARTGITCFPDSIKRPYYISAIDTMPICNIYDPPNNCQIVNGITESHDTYNYNIYPNPATSQLFIQTQSSKPSTISIYYMNGRKLSEEKFSTTVDISSLSPGVYFLELKGEGTVMRKRWVKVN